MFLDLLAISVMEPLFLVARERRLQALQPVGGPTVLTPGDLVGLVWRCGHRGRLRRCTRRSSCEAPDLTDP